MSTLNRLLKNSGAPRDWPLARLARRERGANPNGGSVTSEQRNQACKQPAPSGLLEFLARTALRSHGEIAGGYRHAIAPCSRQKIHSNAVYHNFSAACRKPFRRSAGWSNRGFDWSKWSNPLRQQAGFDQITTHMSTSKKRFNWRVSEDIALTLESLRRKKHFKSWDEFFRAVIIQIEADSGSKLPVPDPTPLRTVLSKLESLEATDREIKSSLDSQNAVTQLVQNVIEQTNDMVCGIRTLMEFAIKPAQPPEPPPDANDGTSKAIRYLRKRY